MEVTEKVCYFDQEPDQRGKLRWVMPGKLEDLCSCTTLRPGGVNKNMLNRPYEPKYTDRPLFTDSQKEIRDYFNCQGENCQGDEKGYIVRI